tara:strand:- start:6083 stop:6253 length:171 start_codon:yes stop_codon:yes gene_type:complete
MLKREALLFLMTKSYNEIGFFRAGSSGSSYYYKGNNKIISVKIMRKFGKTIIINPC